MPTSAILRFWLLQDGAAAARGRAGRPRGWRAICLVLKVPRTEQGRACGVGRPVWGHLQELGSWSRVFLGASDYKARKLLLPPVQRWAGWPLVPTRWGSAVGHLGEGAFSAQQPGFLGRTGQPPPAINGAGSHFAEPRQGPG